MSEGLTKTALELKNASKEFVIEASTLAAKLLNMVDESKAVVFAGVEKGVGTTSIAYAVAVQASLNHKILYVDADFRNSGLSADEVIADKGLSDILLKKIEIKECIKKYNDNMDILGSGTVISEAIPNLITNKLTHLLSETKEKYDLIIVDTPNTKEYSDAVIIGAEAKQMILVITGTSRKKYIINAFNKTDSNNINVLGLVVNKKYKKKK